MEKVKMDKVKMPKGWKVVTYEDVQKAKKKKRIEEDEFLGEFHETPLYTKRYKTGKDEKGFFVSHYYNSNEPYWKRNLLPFLLEVAFVLSCFYLPGKYILFTNFAFYLSLFIFYLVTGSFSFKSWFVNLREGLYFWREVCVTSMLFCAAFAITEGLENLFPALNPGFINFQVEGVIQVIILAITTLFLAPITEECFYRQGIISGESKKMLLLTSVINMVLFAVVHAFAPWGIFLVMLWALPLTWAFLKTRNIYIVITAHMIVSIIGNLNAIISIMIK